MTQSIGGGSEDPYEHDYHNHIEDACPWHFDGNCWITECGDCSGRAPHRTPNNPSFDNIEEPELLDHYDITPSGKQRKVRIHGNPDFDPDSNMFDHLKGETWEPYDESKLPEHNLNREQFDDIIKNMRTTEENND